MNKLEQARENIKKIDKEMAKLFLERMKSAEVVAEYKKECGLPIFDKEQEKRVIDRNSEYIKDQKIRRYYLDYIKTVMDLSKKYQTFLNEGAKVCYSGVEGAFSYIASKRMFKNSKLISYKTFEESYNAVSRGEADACILPIENSYAGEVGKVIDLMFNGDLYVNSISELKVTHNLLGVPGAKLSDIKTVISHPQAISQCMEYIEEKNFEIIYEKNTAIAAEYVKNANDKTIAAIASVEAMEVFGLDLLAKEINTSNENFTKFAVLSKTKNDNPDNTNFMMIFTLSNDAGSGALLKALDVIGKYDVNISSLRSRPLKEGKYKYYFYIEADGNQTSEKFKKMYNDLQEVCDVIKFLGCYKNYRI